MQFLFTNICLKCRTFFTKACLVQERLFLSTSSRSAVTENLYILRDLGISKDSNEKFGKEVSETKPNKLKTTVEVIERLGFSTSDIEAYPKILKHNSKVIDLRFKVLEEGGFEKITIPMILNFMKLASSSVCDLKTRGLIGYNISVIRNILSHCGLPSTLYPAEQEESCLFRDLQVVAVQYFLCWEFNLTLQEIQKVFNTYKIFTLKSIRLIMENYTFLTNNVGLSKELIRQNLYLLVTHPVHYQEFLEHIPMVGVQPVREILKTHPKLLMRPIEKVLEILKILKEYRIPAKSLSMHADILLLSPDTVRKRLQYLQRNPNFQPFFHHPRICKAVISFKNVTKRFDQLNDTKWRTKTLDMLSVRSAIFQGRLKLGHDISKGNDIVHYLHKELKMKRRKVRELMQQNPFWCCAPLVTVTSTLKLLREAGFDSSHISASLPVILYPTKDVAKWLEEINSQPEVECCEDPATGKLRADLVLPLVLYYLEKPFHFTGNGIWDSQTERVPDNLPDHTSLIDPTL